MTEKFTEAMIDKLPSPADGKPYLIHYDSDTRGLGVRVTKKGTRSWIFNYRARGVERRLTIGATKAWPVKLARQEAGRLRRLVDQGRDPMSERHADRIAPSMRDLVDRWRAERAPKMRPRSRAENESLIRQWIDPELGGRKVADVTHQDIDRLHRKITNKGTAVRANRATTFLARLFNLAVTWQLRTDNPVKGLEKNPEQPRHRYLSSAEIKRLTPLLADDYPDRQTADIVRLLLLTGARSGEVLAMRWDQLELGEPAVWAKPAASTKQARLHRVPLNSEARDVLVAIKATRSERQLSSYVFPARTPTGHVRDIKRGWAKLRETASLTDLHVHDLRHSFASLLASEGYSLPLIGALLGHTQASTTQRYAHLLDSAQRQATERLGAIVKKNGTGEVVNFPKGKPA